MTREFVLITAALVFLGSTACNDGSEVDKIDTSVNHNRNDEAGSNAREPDLDSGTSTSASACTNGIVDGNYNAGSRRELEALSGCTEVSGTLSITAQDATDLDALGEIYTVGGAMVVSGLNVSDVDGLNKLTTIGGDLYITGCVALTDLDGLSALTSIEGEVIVRKNQQLSDVKLIVVSNFRRV